MQRFIGIDFGTTNSAVVEFSNNRYTHIGEDEQPIPSVIAVDLKTQKVSYGREVKDKIIEIRSGKKHLVVESVKSALATDSFWNTPSKSWSAKEIARELFHALSKRTEELLGEPILKAVVAIPVNMPIEKRAAIRKAASLAGIKITDFISEATSAFISRAKDLRYCRYVAVFDWGGGTLDISVLEIRNNCISELHTTGWNVAGDEIDKRLAEWIHTRIVDKNGINIAFENIDPHERQILLNETEECKCKLQLEGSQEETIKLAEYAGLKTIIYTVKQEDFRAITRGIATEAVERLLQCVDDAHIARTEIGKLIIVGGSSNLRVFKEELCRKWPYPNIDFSSSAEWDIARGAAWLAANPGTYRTAENIGVILSDDQYHTIFPAGTEVNDAKFNLNFGLVEDTHTATFVFASRKGGELCHKYIGELHVKASGFIDEIIELDSQITEDLVFVATAKSQYQNIRSNSFNYDNIKWMYSFLKDIK